MKKSDFKFLGYKVNNIQVKIDDNFGKKPEELSHNINTNYSISEENNRLTEVVLEVNIKAKSKKFNFYLSLKGLFKANKKMLEATFNTLCKQNAPAILFPYARAIVSNYTALANIRPIVLPLMNLSHNNAE